MCKPFCRFIAPYLLLFSLIGLTAACASSSSPDELILADSSSATLPDTKADSPPEVEPGISAAPVVEALEPTSGPAEASDVPLSAEPASAGGVEVAAIAPTCPEPDLFQAGRICFIGIGGNTLVHPISMASNGESVWLLDGGRLLNVSLRNPSEPAVMLKPGDMIDGVPVQEPFDLALVDGGLLVLDRVGDVYRFDFDDGMWTHDRYARPIGETSSHYYVSLATNGFDRYLLETSYRYGLRYLPNQAETGWAVPEDVVLIDLAVGDPLPGGESVAYLLQRPLDIDSGGERTEIIRYINGVPDLNFRPQAEIRRGRELQVGPTAVYLLDKAGFRLTVFNKENGTVLTQTEFLYPISTFSLHLDQFGSSLLTYAGRNAIYLPGQPDNKHVIETTQTLPHPQPHDLAVWEGLPDFVLPILNLPVDRKELRLPGAPRHYRQGIHQGMDFYWGPGREVLASASGTVIRAMVNYQPPSTNDFIRWRAETNSLGFTSPEALDFYRGRQVWIEHENGYVSRYAHLSQIDPATVEGATVTQGQRIGAVGNSGSPGSLEGPDVDSHLHYELWIGDHYFGQYLRPVEVRELVEGLFINR
ncbi:MAG: M23 family metallopeptidase [Chloroflexota bacterium]